MQTYSDPSRAADPHALPDVEVFYHRAIDCGDGPFDEGGPGWYYWYCFPGCMPDSDPIGPFASAAEAESAAQDQQQDDFNADLSSHIDPADLA